MARWDDVSSTGKVEDRRGQSPSFGQLGGIGGIVIAVLMLVSLFGGSNGESSIPIEDILSELQQPPTAQQAESPEFAGADSYEVFASKVLGTNNDMWRAVFPENSYQEPRLVLFRQSTQSGCGFASSQHGPHYCPNDQTIYLDETFFDVLTQRFGAKGGDLAEAYVIAHEVGHHAQNQLGILQKAQDGTQENAIALELQADCFAGAWAKSIDESGLLTPNEIKEAMDAAAAVGDDRIQQKVEGRVNPEAWTHGSSEDRVYWFNQGFLSGTPTTCDTFNS